MSEFLDLQVAALREAESIFGTIMMWTMRDQDQSYPLRGVPTSGSFIVRKEAVEQYSPVRPPENGDTLTDNEGVQYEIVSVNGAFHQVSSGGFTLTGPRNTDNTAFYRIIYSGAEESR